MATLSRKMGPHCARIRQEREKQQFCELSSMFSNIGVEYKNFKCFQKGNGHNNTYYYSKTLQNPELQIPRFPLPSPTMRHRFQNPDTGASGKAAVNVTSRQVYPTLTQLFSQSGVEAHYKQGYSKKPGVITESTQEPSTLKSLHFSISITVFKSSLQWIPFFFRDGERGIGKRLPQKSTMSLTLNCESEVIKITTEEASLSFTVSSNMHHELPRVFR